MHWWWQPDYFYGNVMQSFVSDSGDSSEYKLDVGALYGGSEFNSTHFTISISLARIEQFITIKASSSLLLLICKCCVKCNIKQRKLHDVY